MFATMASEIVPLYGMVPVTSPRAGVTREHYACTSAFILLMTWENVQARVVK